MDNRVMNQLEQLETLFAKYEITGRELAQVQALEKKLENQQITIAVIGQFKRGKSTLVNAVLGEKVMPVGIVPVTAVVTSVRYGDKGANVHFDNGAVIKANFEDIEAYVNEQENSDNHLGVSRVDVTVPAEFLAEGITLVDTPGVGSAHQKNSDAAYAFVRESDGVVFLLSVDSPINQIEIEFLKKTRAYASKFYFAVNKTDVVDEEELTDYLNYCRKLIAKLMEVEEGEIALFPISAKKKTGIEELTTAVTGDCKSRGADMLEQSVKLKLLDVVKSALSQVTLYRTVLNLSGEEFEERFGKLRESMAEIQADGEGFAEQFKHNSAMLTAQLGTIKNQLSDKVCALFGIEYHYEMEEVELNQQNEKEKGMDSKIFVSQVQEICIHLMDTLNTIFMYREENAYTVVRRINDLNRLVRTLAKIKIDILRDF